MLPAQWNSRAKTVGLRHLNKLVGPMFHAFTYNYIFPCIFVRNAILVIEDIPVSFLIGLIVSAPRVLPQAPSFTRFNKLFL